MGGSMVRDALASAGQVGGGFRFTTKYRHEVVFFVSHRMLATWARAASAKPYPCGYSTTTVISVAAPSGPMRNFTPPQPLTCACAASGGA